MVEFPNMADKRAEDWRKMFYVEYSPVSNSLNCSLRLHGPTDFSHIRVDIEDQTVTLQKDGNTCSYQFDDLELLPLTCRGLKYHKTGELHFNIQGKQLCVTDSSNGEVLYREKQFSFQNKIVERIQLYQNKWFCSVCQQRILKHSSYFSRVLPLPSENWSDFADMWFCHKHEDADSNGGKCNAVQNGKLLPKQRDCLVGDTYVLISDFQVNKSDVKIDKNGAITCSRCGHQIGVVLENKDGVSNGCLAFKLFLSSLTICDLDGGVRKQVKVADSRRRERFFSLLLEEQSQVYTSFRFIIESSVQTTMNQNIYNSTSYCLIWLMDTKASVYSNESDNLQERDMADCSRTCKLVNKGVLKLLFKCQLSASMINRPPDFPTKSLISMWKKDNTVHSITLPHPLFLQLLDQLICNSKSLPVSQRLLNGFHVSFLGKTDSDFET